VKDIGISKYCALLVVQIAHKHLNDILFCMITDVYQSY